MEPDYSTRLATVKSLVHDRLTGHAASLASQTLPFRSADRFQYAAQAMGAAERKGSAWLARLYRFNL